MKKLLHRGWVQWLLSAIVAGMLLFIASRVQTITYLTNDDNAIAFALAGYQTGAPYPYALFTNCLLGYPVSFLYGWFPGVPWWAVLQLCFLWLSMTVLGACLMGVSHRHGRSPLMGLLLMCVLYAALFLTAIVQLTYTVTAAAVGAAGIALLLYGVDAKKRSSGVLCAVFGGVLVVLAFLYREETGFAVLCFFFAATLFRLLRTPKRWKPTAILAGAVLALCAISLVYNQRMHLAVNGEGYETFFRYRERFTDYPRDAYADNPELYESVGWDEPLYRLADNWCFLDERISADALKTITEESHVSAVPLSQALKNFLEFFTEEQAAVLLLALPLILLMYIGGAWFFDRKNAPHALVALLVLLGTNALALYLCLSGRFLFRTYQVLIIPAAAMTAFFAVDVSMDQVKNHRFITGVCLALSLVYGLACGYLQAKELRANSPAGMLADCRAVNAYVVAHPENVYIRDTYAAPDIDAFTVYHNGAPANLISWGGCGMRSDAYDRQLRHNGLSAGDETILRQSNVYFLTRYGSPQEEALLDYLRDKYGAVSVEWKDGIAERYVVYQIVF